jgi:hypothetical protein
MYDTPVPGSSELFSGFRIGTTFYPAVITDGGRIYFPADITTGVHSAPHGVWFYDNGMLETVAMIRGAIPDGTGDYESFSDNVPAHDESGTFRAGHTLGLSVFRVDSEQQITEVIREGTPIPGTGREITGMGWPLISPADSVFVQVQDRVSYGAILRHVNGMLTSMVRTEDPVPNSIFQLIEVWPDFGINARDDVAFTANLTRDRRGLFMKPSDGEVVTLALSGEFVPGAESAFTAFSTPLANDQGVVAFVGSYPGGQGLFAWKDGVITDIALPDQNDTPGSQSPYLSIYRPALNSSNRMAFRAELRDGSTGVWMADPEGNVDPIVLSGQLWDVDGILGGELRTVDTVYFDGDTGGQDGRGSGLNDQNELALRIAFADNSEGIYVLTVPEPESWVLLVGGAMLAFLMLRFRFRGAWPAARSMAWVLLGAITLTSGRTHRMRANPRDGLRRTEFKIRRECAPRFQSAWRRILNSVRLSLICTSALTSVWSANESCAQGVWQRPTGGSWTAAENWSGAVPNAPGDTARFGDSNPTRAAQIMLESPVTIGQLLISNRNPITINGEHPLAFDAGDRVSPGLVELTPQAGRLRIASPLEISGPGLRVNQGDVTITGQVRGSGGLTIDGGTVTLTDNNPYTGPNWILAGEVVVESTNALGSSSGQSKSLTTIGQAGKLLVNLGSGRQFSIDDVIHLDGGIF